MTDADSTNLEMILDRVMRTSTLLGDLQRYVESMLASDPPLTPEQARQVAEYGKAEAARLQQHISALLAAVVEVQQITSTPPKVPAASEDVQRRFYFHGVLGDDPRRKAIRKASQNAK